MAKSSNPLLKIVTVLLEPLFDSYMKAKASFEVKILIKKLS